MADSPSPSSASARRRSAISTAPFPTTRRRPSSRQPGRPAVRYYDTAPLYGLGLSETRLNRFLRGKKRDDYVLSTKVGRLLKVCPPEQRTGIGKFFDTPTRREVYDYSYDGVMRSVEVSLERLGVDRIDILYRPRSRHLHPWLARRRSDAAHRRVHALGLLRAAVAARPGRHQGLRRRHQRVAGLRRRWPSAATSTCSCWPAATRCSSRRRWRASCRSARSAASASCSAAPTIPAFWRPAPKPGAYYNYSRGAAGHPRPRRAHRGRLQTPRRQADRGRAAVSRCCTRPSSRSSPAARASRRCSSNRAILDARYPADAVERPQGGRADARRRADRLTGETGGMPRDN